MAFNPLPSVHINGIEVDGTSLAMPLASIPELTAGEVNSPNGDIRKVAYALVQKLHSAYASMLADDKPTKWISTRVTTAPSEDSETANRTFTFSFQINNPLNTVGATDVVGED
jgi:hypothetical protein